MKDFIGFEDPGVRVLRKFKKTNGQIKKNMGK